MTIEISASESLAILKENNALLKTVRKIGEDSNNVFNNVFKEYKNSRKHDTTRGTQ